jgi:hypothetical protein
MSRLQRRRDRRAERAIERPCTVKLYPISDQRRRAGRDEVAPAAIAEALGTAGRPVHAEHPTTRAPAGSLWRARRVLRAVTHLPRPGP